MLVAQRQARILGEVQRSGAIRVADLVEQLGVSDMTIRRDLDSLERRGLVRKVHGGALAPCGPSTEEPGFEAKSTRQEHEKRTIARTASQLVEPGSAIGLSAGTTTCTLAPYLCEIPDLTVVTNCLRVADAFHQSPRADQTVVLTGGTRTPSDALVGPVAMSTVRSLHLDVLILGVHGIHERAGFTTPNLMEADIDRALVDAACTMVVVADHTKWGVVGISTIAPLKRADILVTDAKIDPNAREILESQVGELMIADDAPAQQES
jgi:DeoR/GlpR family transcriptional regulator of sugar metabolism